MEFLNSGTINILGHIILCCEGVCPVYGRMFSSVPGLYALDAGNTTSPFVTPQNISRCRPMSLGRRISQGGELHGQTGFCETWSHCKVFHRVAVIQYRLGEPFVLQTPLFWLFWCSLALRYFGFYWGRNSVCQAHLLSVIIPAFY